jgi:hypothetical protein
MPPLPTWPDPLDRVRARGMAVTRMGSLTDSDIPSRVDAVVVDQGDHIELAFEIGDLRPGQVFRTRPVTVVGWSARWLEAPDQIPVQLIARAMNRRGDKTIHANLTMQPEKWSLDQWLEP